MGWGAALERPPPTGQRSVVVVVVVIVIIAAAAAADLDVDADESVIRCREPAD
jgi:hypothetical protein